MAQHRHLVKENNIENGHLRRVFVEPNRDAAEITTLYLDDEKSTYGDSVVLITKEEYLKIGKLMGWR